MDHDHHEHMNMDHSALDPRNHSLKDYLPLIVVFVFVALSSAIHGFVTGGGWLTYTSSVMGFFFIYFSLFKVIDLPGFKMGFAEYDLITKKVPVWGYIYPFVEVGLGALYLLGNNSAWLNIITIVVTGLNVLSVSIKLGRKEKFMCACLGTVLKVPLTTVTLIEYGLMGLMAAVMLFA